MRIGFGNYTYFDPNADDKTTYKTANDAQKQKYGFNQTYFNQLIGNRQYNDAADYAAQYHFNDPKTQREHENDIINLRRNGRILGAIYSRIDDPDKLSQVEFFDKVFTSGGLEQLSGNAYADKFADYKKQLGSARNTTTGNIEKEATGLSVTFYPGTQKGIFGIDWLKKDNENTIDNFYAFSGLSENELKAKGVEIIKKDGKTTLRFDKSNDLANQIIYNLPKTTEHNLLGIQGYDEKGQDIDYEYEDFLIFSGNKYDNGGWAARAIQNLVNDSEKSKDAYFQKTDLAEKDYSSTIGPAIDDNITALKASYQAGEIDETTFNRQFKILGNYITAAVQSLGSGNYEMYTNGYNEEITDETLISADNEQRAHLVNLISKTNPKDMELLSMCSNGKIGTLVVINAGGLSTKEEGALSGTATPEEQYSTRRIEIFIPGLMEEQAQAKINGNTSSRSVQEANAMLDWNYDYDCQDGTKLSPDGHGGFMKDGEHITREEALKSINKDMIIQDAVANLKYNYLTWNGNLISDKDNSMLGAEQYEAMARLIAVRAGNELDPNIPLVKADGTPYSVDDIFNIKGLSTSYTRYNDELTGEISQRIPYQIGDKLKNIYDVYESIMKELQYYNVDPDFKLKK